MQLEILTPEHKVFSGNVYGIQLPGIQGSFEILEKQIKSYEFKHLLVAPIDLREKITALIEQYNPDECAVECPFFGENAQSMLKLGRAQGVSMVAALSKGVPVDY